MPDDKEPTQAQIKRAREIKANGQLNELIQKEADNSDIDTVEFLKFALNSWSIPEKISWLKNRGQEINITYK